MGVLKQKGKTVDSVYYVLNSDFDVVTPQVTSQVTPQVAPQVAPQDDIQTKCNELVLFCRIPRSKKEMMAFLKLSDRKSFDILADAVQESPRHERRTGKNLVLMRFFCSNPAFYLGFTIF